MRPHLRRVDSTAPVRTRTRFGRRQARKGRMHIRRIIPGKDITSHKDHRAFLTTHKRGSNLDLSATAPPGTQLIPSAFGAPVRVPMATPLRASILDGWVSPTAIKRRSDAQRCAATRSEAHQQMRAPSSCYLCTPAFQRGRSGIEPEDERERVGLPPGLCSRDHRASFAGELTTSERASSTRYHQQLLCRVTVMVTVTVIRGESVQINILLR